jgi:hypothetical protein
VAEDCCAAGAPPRVFGSGWFAACTGAARGRTPARSLPLRGGSELVTAACPLLRYASSVKGEPRPANRIVADSPASAHRCDNGLSLS